MNICYVSRELPPAKRCGGIGVYVWEMARKLAALGHRVTVISASDDTRLEEESFLEGVRVIRLAGGDFAVPGAEPCGDSQWCRYLRSISRYHSYRRRLGDILSAMADKGEMDLIEFAEYGSESLYWLKRRRPVPTILRCHTPATLNRKNGKRISWKPLRSWDYWAALKEYEGLSRADSVSSCSESLADWVAADGCIPREKITTIPNFIECQLWRGADGCHPEESGSEESKVFFAGTIAPGKGVEDLIRAVLLLKGNGQTVSLDLAGKRATYAESLERKYAPHFGPGGTIRMLGGLSREELRGRYRAATVACFPSWWEGFGLVCIEAMAAGALVIGSTAGGMPEIITDGVDGFLVPPRNPVMLAAAIQKALNLTPEVAAIMRSRAQDKVLRRFDSSIVVPEMLDYYRSVIEKFKKGTLKERATA